MTIPTNYKNIKLILTFNEILGYPYHHQSGYVFEILKDDTSFLQEKVVIGKCVDNKLHKLNDKDIIDCLKLGFKMKTSKHKITNIVNKINILDTENTLVCNKGNHILHKSEFCKKRNGTYYKSCESCNIKQRVYRREEHGEMIKIQQKNYRLENRVEQNKKRSEKITCGCGSIITKGGKSIHENTDKHKKYIKNNPN